MPDLPTHAPPLAAPVPHWRGDGYQRLGAPFVTQTAPQPLQQPFWVGLHASLVRQLGWQDWLPASPGEDLLQAFAGNAVLPGSAPVATVYSGHQFGVWAGQLGDGRALLLGELDSTLGPQELQLKGAGRTRYSRMGDGRAVLRSSIREYLCSAAMDALGIPTTRALTLVGSTTPVLREREETAAVVARIAPSLLRFGHFEHFSANRRMTELRQLADFLIARHFPELLEADDGGKPYEALLREVSRRTAALIAQWQAVGFVHGVMNTDNMSMLGLTLDYGPFQFLDRFEPARITNHSDQQGRYVLSRQPAIGYWNLLCLAQALLPLIGSEDAAVAAIDGYRDAFPAQFNARMAAKLGALPGTAEDAVNPVLTPLLQAMARERCDHTIFWRRLAHAAIGGDFAPVQDLFADRPGIDAWMDDYRRWLDVHGDAASIAGMLRASPHIVLRNHLAEKAIADAENGDFDELVRLMDALSSPYDERPEHAAYADFPPDWADQIHVSCSS
ncbi:YdiU family protein [Corticibacter populi]|uniref:Protein nucleotidyltransferase YdiU n=1 Tax=Corticibacter populi TaxID=1550736 RepID=A0A3M6R0T7_9BURK|nr:YdiU family protein [Corticibacter populi]RMX08876.1 YdiU family protein [Corticibacter populi]